MQPAPSNGVSVETGRWVLFAAILASSMAFIDGSALNVALDALQADLQASAQELYWVVSAYLLPFAALVLVGGALGDRYGRKRVFMIGIVLFAAASLACGLAPTAALLIVGRFVQGIGAALMVPGSLALISALFPSDRRGVAIGTWSAFTTLTTVAGPLVGGWLAENGLWRGVFFLNIPLAILSLYALIVHVPESHDTQTGGSLDWLGAALATVGLAGITYGFIQGSEVGLGQPEILLSLAIGVIALIAFVFVEARAAHPMMPLHLFKSSTFSGTNALTVFLYGALGGSSFFLPLYLIQAHQYPPSAAGWSFLPFILLLTLLSRRMGALVDRYGPRLFLTVGPVIVALAFVLQSLPGLTNGFSDYWTTFFPSFVVLGIGMGIVVAPLTTAVMSAVPQHNAGTASGINNAAARTGGVLATAILGAIAIGIFTGALNTHAAANNVTDEVRTEMIATASDLGNMPIPAGLSEADTAAAQQAVRLAFVDTFRLVCYICAGLSLLSAALAWWLVKSKPEPQTA